MRVHSNGMSKRLSTLLVVSFLACTVGCDDAATPQRDPSEVLSWASEDRFGAAIDPDQVIARVEQAEITVADVAVCLTARPDLTTRECLDELIDTELVTLQANDDDQEDPRIDDARASSLASVFLREEIVRPLDDDSVSELEIDEFVNEPLHRLYFGAPELRQFSHLLVLSEDGPNDDVRALAQQIATETDWANVTAADALDRLRDRWSDRAAELNLQILVEKNLVTHNENDVSPPWPIFTPVVQEFADGLFALERPSTVSPVVETPFGVHFILLERIIPAARMSDEDARALARAEVGQRRRHESLQQLILSLREGSQVIHGNAIEIFRANDDQLLQERSSEIRESLRPE